MPILKLYSMVLYRKKWKINYYTHEKYEIVSEEGLQLLNQMLDYLRFALVEYFKELIGDGSNQELKQILSVVFNSDIYEFMVKFAPTKAAQVISSLLINTNCIK